MHEVHNLLLSCPGMDKTLGVRLLNHLLKSLPHISTEAGGTTSVGTRSPLPLSPTQSLLNLPSLHPHPLHLHTPPTPSPPSSPTHSPRVSSVRERPHEQSSPPRSPSPQSPARSALPPFFPGADPSMWRPWWMNAAQPPICPPLALPWPAFFYLIVSIKFDLLGDWSAFHSKGCIILSYKVPWGCVVPFKALYCMLGSKLCYVHILRVWSQMTPKLPSLTVYTSIGVLTTCRESLYYLTLLFLSFLLAGFRHGVLWVLGDLLKLCMFLYLKCKTLMVTQKW